MLCSISLTSQAQVLNCYEINLMNSVAGTQCATNDRKWIVKLENGDLKFAGQITWMSPTTKQYSYEEAINYCQSIGATLPTIDDVNKLLSSLKDPRTQKTQQLFKTNKTNHETAWLADKFSSAMSYLWSLQDNKTNSRYFTEHAFNVICLTKGF